MDDQAHRQLLIAAIALTLWRFGDGGRFGAAPGSANGTGTLTALFRLSLGGLLLFWRRFDRKLRPNSCVSQGSGAQNARSGDEPVYLVLRSICRI